ncbi:thermonuclease family protein [Novosphingobium sp. BW1]|nr:thermonuclease family protein [Novosphingobium sp. BW1]
MWMEAGWPGIAGVADTNAAPSLCIGSVHDGDTIRTCAGERVRIENIDAPELPNSPKCADRRRQGWCDYSLAVRSRDELASFLKGGHVAISRSGTDRYGRTLARLLVDGRDAGDHLVELGLARPWQ